jgi:hypothetical protein
MVSASLLFYSLATEPARTEAAALPLSGGQSGRRCSTLASLVVVSPSRQVADECVFVRRCRARVPRSSKSADLGLRQHLLQRRAMISLEVANFASHQNRGLFARACSLRQIWVLIARPEQKLDVWL